MVPGHQAQPQPEPIPAAVFPDLNISQAYGRQCVVCRTSYLDVSDGPAPVSVVVGRSGSTGHLVRACRERCAPMIGWVAPSTAVQETLI